jgi:catechol 2,3-dioxygenase-like lactoylglutathione lyase family enzyme
VKLSELAFFTPEVAALGAFYRHLLGTQPEFESPDLTIFDHQGIKVLIHRTYMPGPGDLPPEDQFAFEVPDVDRACVALEAAGLKITTPPREYEWGRSAYLRDPDGHLIELHQQVPAPGGA